MSGIRAIAEMLMVAERGGAPKRGRYFFFYEMHLCSGSLMV